MLTENQKEIQKQRAIRRTLAKDTQEQNRQIIYEINQINALTHYRDKLISYFKEIAKVILRRRISSDEKLEQIKQIMKEVRKVI